MTDDVDDAAYRCTYDHPNTASGTFLKVRIHPSEADNYKEISTSNRARYEYTSGDILYFKMPANTIRDLDFFLNDVKV